MPTTTQDDTDTALDRALSALSAFTDVLVAPGNNSDNSPSPDGEIPPSQSLADSAQPHHENFHVEFAWPDRTRLPSTIGPRALDCMVPILLTGNSQPDATTFLRALADSLHRQYERTGDVSDLERAISTTMDAIQATNDSHPTWPALETAYRARYRLWSERTGKMPDTEVQSMRFADKGTSWLPPELTPSMGLFVPVMVWTGDLPVVEGG
ncbi:hypothetical protein B0T25DRAFT_521355 [Lasiosphaeria hispida]|uniref:Uncharacterized protein n=1 Tax=Lasiosphaeria hispida TaxID=260671 RepID=A0AAJ0MBN5_9PEZI|nr:hypothetical protein B0T25DRAFT_521355 [Lasiosphaeria hispida]